jgi:hypothetical protein
MSHLEMHQDTQAMAAGRTSRREKPQRDKDARASRLDSAVTAIKAALDLSKARKARQIVIVGHRKRLWPSAARRLDWWRNALGPAAFTKFSRALATEDCLYCEGGIVQCQACRGKGMLDEGPCEDCAAIGVTPCGFCGGSGCAVLDDFPIGLRKAAMSHRLTMSMQRVAQVTKGTSRRDGSQSDRLRLAQELVRLNRAQAVVANALELLGALSRKSNSDAALPTNAAKSILQECRTAAIQIEQRLRETLKGLGIEERRRAAALKGSKRDRAIGRAEYFDQLAKSKYFGKSPLNRKTVGALITIYAPTTRRQRPK